MSTIERKRDLSHITPEQEEALKVKLAAKLSEILGKASNEANQFLNQYGIEVKIGYVLREQKEPKAKKAKKA